MQQHLAKKSLGISIPFPRPFHSIDKVIATGGSDLLLHRSERNFPSVVVVVVVISLMQKPLNTLDNNMTVYTHKERERELL